MAVGGSPYCSSHMYVHRSKHGQVWERVRKKLGHLRNSTASRCFGPASGDHGLRSRGGIGWKDKGCVRFPSFARHFNPTWRKEERHSCAYLIGKSKNLPQLSLSLPLSRRHSLRYDSFVRSVRRLVFHSISFSSFTNLLSLSQTLTPLERALPPSLSLPPYPSLRKFFFRPLRHRCNLVKHRSLAASLNL